MATGFTQRFKGKIAAQVLHLGSGGIVDAVSGAAGKAVVAQKLAMTVTATANTDFTMTVPTGCSLIQVMAYTSTAFGAATDALLSVGSAAGGEQYVAQTTIKAAGTYVATLVSAAKATTSGTLNIRITQTGTASATGAATLLVLYMVP